MTAEDQTTPLARAAGLVQRGPVSANGARQSLSNVLRRALLRAMRPYTYHQHEVDAEIVGALRGLQAQFESVGKRHAEQIERLEEIARELILTAELLRKAAADASGQADEAIGAADRALVGIESVEAELNAPPYMDGQPFEAFRAPVGEVIGFRSRGSGHEGREDGSDYVAFEDLFRGPSKRVTDLQRPYLELVKTHQPVLDLGCGRGEFLALLAEDGIEARGVDGDAGMVARCRTLGVEVVESDINEYLASVEDGTLGTIFSAQVIEHLPYDELRRMLDLALRKLRPGGLLIAETVNPHRISSLKTFWVDLTHQHPIFPEVALTLCGTAGFESAYVFAPTFDSYEEARLVSPAYAVVATSPGLAGALA